MNNYMKRRYRQRRELALSILGSNCTNCGSETDIQIDHKYWTEKHFNFNKMWNCSKEKFLAELQKCQPLCKTCHIEKSRVDLWDRRLNTGGGANQYGPY